MSARQLALVCAWGGVVFFDVTGAWLLLAPHTFFSSVAAYPPYNRHLFHDVGAFTLGISAGLGAGIAGRKALAVGLWGGAVGATLHAVSHWIDASLGGRSTDPLVQTIFAAALVVGLIAAESGP